MADSSKTMSVREEYIAQLREEAASYPPIPSVTVEMDNVSYVLRLPEKKVRCGPLLVEHTSTGMTRTRHASQKKQAASLIQLRVLILSPTRADQSRH
jgi:hypothetical protein